MYDLCAILLALLVSYCILFSHLAHEVILTIRASISYLSILFITFDLFPSFIPHEGRESIILNTRRRFSKKKMIILFAIILGIAIVAFMSFLNAIDPFRHLRITIHNQSDYDLTNIQASLVQGDNSFNNNESGSTYIFDKDIPTGANVKFAPQLKLSGEGVVSLAFTDSRGKTYNKTVCGYTEYLSGNSYVTVTNENITVKDECM